MSALKIQQGSSKHSAYDLRDPFAEAIVTGTAQAALMATGSGHDATTLWANRPQPLAA